MTVYYSVTTPHPLTVNLSGTAAAYAAAPAPLTNYAAAVELAATLRTAGASLIRIKGYVGNYAAAANSAAHWNTAAAYADASQTIIDFEVGAEATRRTAAYEAAYAQHPNARFVTVDDDGTVNAVYEACYGER